MKKDEKKDERRHLPKADADTQREMHKLNIRIAGLTKTAETAAEMGDTEHYIELCRQVTILELKKEMLLKRGKVGFDTVADSYQHTSRTLLNQ